MKLILKKGHDTEWVFWAHQKAKNAKRFISVARVKKDGYFYKKDMEIIGEKISALYGILKYDFEGEDIFLEERELLKENLHKMNAQQFTALTNIMLDPYTVFVIEGDPDRP